MARDWFCKIEGQQWGPYSPDEMRLMATDGRLRPDHEVKFGDQGVWIKAEALGDLFPQGGAPAPPIRQAASGVQAAPVAQPRAGHATVTTSATTRVPPKPQPVPPNRVAVEDPLEAIASSDVKIHSTGRASGKHHGKKADNSALFVIVPVCIVVLIGCVIFISTMMTRDTVLPTERLDEMLARKAEEQQKAVENNPPAAPENKKPELPSFLDSASTPSSSSPPSPQPKTPEPPLDDGNWRDASKEAAPCGHATVKVVSAEITAPKVISGAGKEARAKETMLLLTLEVRNNRKDRALEYTSWSVGGPKMGLLALTDNRSRPCAAKFKAAFGGFALDGQLTKATIEPDASVEDVLAFTQPRFDGNLKYLRLQLPGSALGEKGFARLEIPESMIVVKPVTVDAPPPKPVKGPEAPADAPPAADPNAPPPGAEDEKPEAGAELIGNGLDEFGELKRDESDLPAKRAAQEAAEKAAAEEKAARDSKNTRPANPAEGLFKPRRLGE